MILKNHSTIEIEEYARSKGMNSMRYNGLEKFFEGKTSLDEIIRVMH